MKKIFILMTLMLLFTISISAQARAYYQKVVAQDGSDILTLVSGTGASYTAPNYSITARILEVPNEILQTGITQTTSLRLARVGNGSSVPYYAAVYVQLGAFPTQWVAGETLHITVTKTDMLPNQSTSWVYTIPTGTSTINIQNPVQEIPPCDVTLPIELVSFTASNAAEGYVELQWVTSSESGLLGYRIYRNTSNDETSSIVLNQSLIPATNTSTTSVYSYTDTTVHSNTQYYYWLECTSTEPMSYYFGPINITTSNSPQVILSSFSAVTTEQNIVLLSWITESENNLIGYNVLRSTDNVLNNSVQVNPALIGGTNTSTTQIYFFTDNEIEPSMTYYYWLEMAFLDGSSEFSNYVTVTTYEMGIIPELASFTGTPIINPDNTESVLINWTTDSETNVLGYHVFCSPDTVSMPFEQINTEIIPATNTSSTYTYSMIHESVMTNHWYYYYVEMVDMEGSLYRSPTIAVLTYDISNPPTPQTAPVTHINNVYPNPFHENNHVSIDFEVKHGETATLSIYNIRGQCVRTFSSLSVMERLIQWDGRDMKGNVCGNGIYLCRLSSQNSNSVKKVVVIK